MRDDIIAKVREAGVVGAGGAGFPTHIKLAAKAETVVVNGAECEPLLRVDQQLLEKYCDRLMRGLTAAMDATGATGAVIALKAKYRGAIAALETACQGLPVRLHILDDFYPAGDEHVTVMEATGRLIPQGGLPLAAGCVVLNAETLYNIAGALDGMPVTHTWLTVTGAVPRPYTAHLPLGLAVREAAVMAGLSDLSGMAVIDGGPMMGRLVASADQPVTKTTKGLIVLPDNHPIIVRRRMPLGHIVRQARTSCVQCRYCTDLCPRYLLGHRLEPHRIMRTLSHLGVAGGGDVAAMALVCSECGLCEQYACPVGLSPRLVNAHLKQSLLSQGVRPGGALTEQAVRRQRDGRKIPVKRLTARLGLARYDRSAPLMAPQYMPTEVTIPLKQHAGAPARPIVRAGQTVVPGELIAAASGDGVSANIHASIGGQVMRIDDSFVVIAGSEGGDGAC